MEQDPAEFNWFCRNYVNNTKSLLEVGSAAGGTLIEASRFLQPGARIRSVDLGVDRPSASWAWQLDKAIARLRACGFDAKWLRGDSRDSAIIAAALADGPYDVVFIDAGHEYDDVKSDWLNYGPMGHVVGFHDVAHDGEPDVGRLWTEIKGLTFRTDEIVRSSSMGIGVVIDVAGTLAHLAA